MPRRPHRPTGPPSPPSRSPDGTAVRVELAGHVVRLNELRARPQRYARWFAAARRHPGHATCRCTRDGERLVIREIAGVFHLARWPRTRDNHRPGCPFFTIESRHASTRAAPRAAITATDHGTRITVGYAFTTADPSDGSTVKDHEDNHRGLVGGTREHTATVTGLGLLHWLFEASGLNTWPPGETRGTRRTEPPRRDWADVHTALVQVLAGLRLGEHPAPRLAYVVAPYRPGRADPARDARIAEFLRPLEHPEQVTIRGGPHRGQTRTLRHRRLLCGEVKALAETERGHKLTLRHFPRPIFLSDDLVADLSRRFPAPFSSRRGPTARRVVLALIEGTPRGHLRLVDAAVMLTTDVYIPVDSSHELTMANALIAAQRGFTKPLRYDHDETSLPDFVLTDLTTNSGTGGSSNGPATVVEVWGLSSSAYLERKRAKVARYYAEGTRVIERTPPEQLPALDRPPC